MDGIPEFSRAEVEELLAKLPDEPYDTPVMDADDLGRLSIERMVAKQAGTERMLRSRGRLHFTGDGVEGHTMEVSSFASTIAGYQDLVSAVGANLDGHDSGRGRISQEVVRKTTLLVDASPLPGSVQVVMIPKADALAEVEPGGPSLFEDLLPKERTLADRASEIAIGLLTLPDDPDLDDWTGKVRSGGPRVARTLRRMFSAIEKADIAVDASWQEPGNPTVRSTLRTVDARRGIDAIDRCSLTDAQVVLRGTLHMVDDIHPRALEIEGSDGPFIVQRGNLSDEDLHRLTVGCFVEVEAVEQIASGAGGDRTTLTALSVIVRDAD